MIKTDKRLFVLRKNLGLSQEKFGAMLGITGASISRLEKGERSITEQMIKSICREFSVNREWFVEGIGDMFLDKSKDVLDLLFDLAENEKEFIIDFCRLSQDQRQTVVKLINLK